MCKELLVILVNMVVDRKEQLEENGGLRFKGGPKGC
jgi:hypothetical protein